MPASYFLDTNILLCAYDLDATKLLTEDLNHEQDYEGVRAINPFKG